MSFSGPPRPTSLAELERKLNIAFHLLRRPGGNPRYNNNNNKRSAPERLDEKLLDEMVEGYEVGPETWADYDSWGVDKRGLGSIAK